MVLGGARLAGFVQQAPQIDVRVRVMRVELEGASVGRTRLLGRRLFEVAADVVPLVRRVVRGLLDLA